MDKKSIPSREKELLKVQRKKRGRDHLNISWLHEGDLLLISYSNALVKSAVCGKPEMATRQARGPFSNDTMRRQRNSCRENSSVSNLTLLLTVPPLTLFLRLSEKFPLSHVIYISICHLSKWSINEKETDPNVMPSCYYHETLRKIIWIPERFDNVIRT